MAAPRSPIRQLSNTLANQIAAGEVVERPASVLKELAENALDAGATSLRLQLTDAGLTQLILTDNGSGIPKEELLLALSRHATSKIWQTEDLFNLHTFGFRGEALPSIASVSRLTLTSRPATQTEAWQVNPNGSLQPAAHPVGTTVTVADLFYATPARRKFLKSARAEQLAIDVIIRNLLLSQPQLALQVVEDGVTSWHVPPVQGHFSAENLTPLNSRLTEVVGTDFAQQALPVHAVRNDDFGAPITLHGFVSPPTMHTSSSAKQWLFVNNRPVKDRALQTALKSALTDQLPAGRHPLAVLFLTLPANAVDVNVHPAKTEVRFQNPNAVYSLVLGGVRQAVAVSGLTAAPASWTTRATHLALQEPLPTTPSFNLATPPHKLWKDLPTPSSPAESAPTILPNPAPEPSPSAHPLGAAIGQIANTYIVAESADGSLVLVDQHAAHERLVYEQLKQQILTGQVLSQPLLLPVLVPCTVAEGQQVLAHQAQLQQLGVELALHSPTSLAVLALPHALGSTNPVPLVADLLSELAQLPAATNPRTTLTVQLEKVLATIACHHSIRAHRRLSLAEQNELLRQIEATPASRTCNHGRPTVITLSLPELQKRFARR